MKERWQEIKDLFGAVYELPPEARRARLAEPGIDPAVRREVERLLGASDGGAGLLDEPAIVRLDLPSLPQSGLAGRTLGAYRVVREIGRGGMGTVYEGHRADQAFDRRVAIKTLRVGLDLPELVTQFRQERQILAGLQHPNIAALLDGGVTDDGIPYLILEYVDGVPIDRYCEDNRLDLRARLDLFRQVLDAVRYAHTHLVIHRDIKPGNILVTPDGLVKLLDFGVARLARPDGLELTQPGTAAITPAYASPEQLRGERASTTTDVYSLALVLYRLLTGKTPHRGDTSSPAALLEALATGPLPAPSTDPAPEAARAMGLDTVGRLRRLLTGELDAVLLKALRLEPDRRYSSVEALDEDLLRYLKGLPVTARPDTAWYRFSKFVRRRRAMVAAVAVAAAALVVRTAISLWQAREARLQARRATKLATFLQEVIGASAPMAEFKAPRLGPAATLAELVDTAAARIDASAGDDPETAAVLHHLFGLAYQSQERHDRALVEFASMERAARAAFGPGLADVVALTGRAAGAAITGAGAAADSLLGEALRLLDRLDPRHPDRYLGYLRQFGIVADASWPDILLGIRVQLESAKATLALQSGRAAEALSGARLALRLAQSSPGVPADIRAGAMAVLGTGLLATSADRTEGDRLLRGALAAVDSLADPDIPVKAEILSSLVAATVATGREADSLSQEALRIYQRATGPNSLTVANQLWLRGGSARLRGDTATQVASLTRAMRIVASHPAATPPFRQAIMMEYARSHWLQGNLDSAVILAERVYQDRRPMGGFPRAEAGQLLAVLRRIRAERRPASRAADLAAAEPVLLEADSIVRRLVPPEHFWPQLTAGSLVRHYRLQGNEAAARRFLALLPDSARAKFTTP